MSQLQIILELKFQCQLLIIQATLCYWSFQYDCHCLRFNTLNQSKFIRKYIHKLFYSVSMCFEGRSGPQLKQRLQPGYFFWVVTISGALEGRGDTANLAVPKHFRQILNWTPATSGINIFFSEQSRWQCCISLEK